ncbi:MAG: CHASE domain-containing protein [Verrucomicrobia bacterium]|nr:CHASE domain-containing protein [Verrucomicrobiota bacterium]
MPARIHRFLGRFYWPAWVTLVLGLTTSAWLARSMYRQAETLDDQRFKLETLILSQLVEGTMERYEERLARLADYCAQFEELPAQVWSFRLSAMTQPGHNLPSVMHVAYCPKIVAADFKAHAERGRVVHGDKYAFEPQPHPDRELALPVWRFWSRTGFQPLRLGTDLAREGAWHPAMRTALGNVRPWISSRPVRVPRTDGNQENGFWFVIPGFKPDQAPLNPSRQSGESDDEFRHRIRSVYTAAATGLLAVFISTDRMLDQAYNNPGVSPRVHVRLYASPEPTSEILLNPVSPAPAKPRHREVIVQPWYGRRWTLEMNSTPRFETESPRHRAWLVLAAGTGMTLLASALVGLALRAAQRQGRLTGQIREARDALTAAQKEREKLGHDLHDNTIQTLYAVQLGLKHTVRRLAEEPAAARRELAGVQMELDAVIAQMRRFIAAEERQEQAVDLPAVLLASVQRAQTGPTPEVRLQCDEAASDRLTGTQAVQLANIAREALSNSLRHAEPQRVEVSLRSETDAVCLEVTDDGRGFNPGSPARQGVGLASMAARAREIGGTLDLQSAPGQGTRVVVRVAVPPLVHEDAAENSEDPADP